MFVFGKTSTRAPQPMERTGKPFAGVHPIPRYNFSGMSTLAKSMLVLADKLGDRSGDEQHRAPQHGYAQSRSFGVRFSNQQWSDWDDEPAPCGGAQVQRSQRRVRSEWRDDASCA